jgi:molybdenum cofactor biosynthesis protein B
MPGMNHEGAISRGCGIVTISATHQSELDESGTIVRDALVEAGHRVVHQRWLSDVSTDIRYLFREWVDDARFDVIIAIGGTGIAAKDITPEALAPLVTKPMPGFGEVLRRLLFDQLGIVALETRAMAAVCHSTLVYLIPGHPEAAKIATSKLILPQLHDHVPTAELRPSQMPRPRIPPNRFV